MIVGHIVKRLVRGLAVGIVRRWFTTLVTLGLIGGAAYGLAAQGMIPGVTLPSAALVSAAGSFHRPSEPGEVKVWDLSTNREEASLPDHGALLERGLPQGPGRGLRHRRHHVPRRDHLPRVRPAGRGRNRGRDEGDQDGRSDSGRWRHRGGDRAVLIVVSLEERTSPGRNPCS